MTTEHEPIGPDPLSDASRPSSTAEDLDEDAIGADPLEEGMDPPEHWSSVSETGRDDFDENTETLDERLREEEPDVVPEADPEQDRLDDY